MIMSTIEQQLNIEKQLTNLYIQRSNIHKKIVCNRKKLDKFIFNYGNLKLQKIKKDEWKKQQIINAKLRKTPEWKQWRENQQYSA